MSNKSILVILALIFMSLRKVCDRNFVYFLQPLNVPSSDQKQAPHCLIAFLTNCGTSFLLPRLSDSVACFYFSLQTHLIPKVILELKRNHFKRHSLNTLTSSLNILSSLELLSKIKRSIQELKSNCQVCFSVGAWRGDLTQVFMNRGQKPKVCVLVFGALSCLYRTHFSIYNLKPLKLFWVADRDSKTLKLSKVHFSFILRVSFKDRCKTCTKKDSSC